MEDVAYHGCWRRLLLTGLWKLSWSEVVEVVCTKRDIFALVSSALRRLFDDNVTVMTAELPKLPLFYDYSTPLGQHSASRLIKA